jgi:hypothetical protein
MLQYSGEVPELMKESRQWQRLWQRGGSSPEIFNRKSLFPGCISIWCILSAFHTSFRYKRSTKERYPFRAKWLTNHIEANI